jgi:hypothetical protein
MFSFISSRRSRVWIGKWEFILDKIESHLSSIFLGVVLGYKDVCYELHRKKKTTHKFT